VYEIRQTREEPGHQLDGHPVRLGAQLEHGTQVTFLLANGSEADVSLCRDCAGNLRPEHYREMWRACVLRGDVSLALAGRSANERRVAWATMLARYPIAQVRRRHEVDGILAIDRRG